jgi:hypothetical protein
LREIEGEWMIREIAMMAAVALVLTGRDGDAY